MQITGALRRRDAKDWVTGIPTPTSGLVCLAYEIQDSSLDPNFVVTPNEILVDRLGNRRQLRPSS